MCGSPQASCSAVLCRIDAVHNCPMYHACMLAESCERAGASNTQCAYATIMTGSHTAGSCCGWAGVAAGRAAAASSLHAVLLCVWAWNAVTLRWCCGQLPVQPFAACSWADGFI
jgi:hypothetical protein